MAAELTYEQDEQPGPERATICATCIKLYIVNAKDHWTRWLCMAAPNRQINIVTGTIDPPYRLCRFVNNGNCPMYVEGVNQLHPKTVEETTDAPTPQ